MDCKCRDPSRVWHHGNLIQQDYQYSPAVDDLWDSLLKELRVLSQRILLFLVAS